MLRVTCNTRSQRDSQHGEVTPRTNISRTRCCFTTPPVDHEVSGADWLPVKESLVKPIQLCVGCLCLSHSHQKSTCTTNWHTRMMGSGYYFFVDGLLPQSHSKNLPCASMHIHLFRGSLLKTKQFPNTQREPLVQLPPNGMRDSTLLHQGYAPWSWEFPRRIPCGVYRHSVGELLPTSVFRIKIQYVESLVVEVDVRYKPLLKASELLLLLLHHDDKPIGIPQSVWRWSGWSCRVVRLDGWLLHTSLRFGEPHRLGKKQNQEENKIIEKALDR
jgi:hypothetical protein